MTGVPVQATLVVLLACALTRPGSAQESSTGSPGSNHVGANEQATVDGVIARWREALDLDLAAEVVADGAARFLEGSALERDGEARALYARALAATGDLERALALLEGAPEDERTRASIDLARARIALERDELARARDLVLAPSEKGAASVRFADRPEGWLLAGRVLARSGDEPAAEKLLLRFVEMSPHDAEVPAAWHMIAQAALRRGDAAAATRARERAGATGQWQAYYKTRRLQIHAQPTEPLPRLGLAQLWLAAGEPARAKTVLRDLLTINTAFCRAIALEGVCERALGDAAAARSAWQRAIECDPKLPEPRYERALLAIAEGKPADARADLEWLVAQPSGNESRFLRAHLELARLLRGAGDEEGARLRYERYLALGGKEPH